LRRRRGKSREVVVVAAARKEAVGCSPRGVLLRPTSVPAFKGLDGARYRYFRDLKGAGWRKLCFSFILLAPADLQSAYLGHVHAFEGF
jgi:hypothetical protein